MASTNSIQFALRAAVKKLARDTVADRELKRIIKKEAEIELDSSTILEIAKNANIFFILQCNTAIDNLIQDDEIMEKIEELKGLVEGAASENGGKGDKGWRPVGEPEIDASGHIRMALLDYEKRLTSSITFISQEVEEKKMKLNSLRGRLAENPFVAKNMNVMSTTI